MSWRVDFSPPALKFLERNRLSEAIIIDKIKLVLRKFNGERVSANVRKLSGKWAGFYRIRSGNMRIIAGFQFENHKVYIDEIDWRGNVYK